jgi:hypothetical protein
VVSPGESSAKRRRRRQKLDEAAVGGWVWISVADQKRGSVGALWYQGMSRVCPRRPQSNPREARKESCIRKAYGGRRTSNIQHPTSNGRRKPPKATPGRMENAEWRVQKTTQSDRKGCGPGPIEPEIAVSSGFSATCRDSASPSHSSGVKLVGPTRSRAGDAVILVGSGGREWNR